MEENFFERVYQTVRQIPQGRVTSYGAIAKALGAARSARMVGWAMNASHNLEDVPAHRVVNRNGMLSGKHHFQGTNLMQQLLESEGVVVVDACGPGWCAMGGCVAVPSSDLGVHDPAVDGHDAQGQRGSIRCFTNRSGDEFSHHVFRKVLSLCRWRKTSHDCQLVSTKVVTELTFRSWNGGK